LWNEPDNEGKRCGATSDEKEPRGREVFAVHGM
jgi:hypothetical protein